MNPTTNPMKKETLDPLRHKYYSIIRDMYHPFLYDNYYYCEMSDQRLASKLEARDIYVKTIQINVMDALLTDQERDWVHFLRNCCLFEMHRRKYKLVLNDMMAYVRRHEDRQLLRSDYEIAPYFKVWQWLRRYLDSPRYESDQEDIEYHKINNQPVISFEHPVRNINQEIQRRAIMPCHILSSNQEVVCEVLFQRVGPAPSEPTTDYYAAFESAEGSVATSTEETRDMNEGMGNTVPYRKSETVIITPENSGTACAAPAYEETAPAAPEHDKAVCAAPENEAVPEESEAACAVTKKDVRASVVSKADVQPIGQNDQPAGTSFDTQESCQNEPSSKRGGIILYEEYPRDFFYAHPELFEIHTVESLGKLMSDREYIKQREGRKEELKEMARKREIALAEYYAEKAKESATPKESDAPKKSDAPRKSDALKEIESVCTSAVTVTIDYDNDSVKSASSAISQFSFNEPDFSYNNDAQLPSLPSNSNYSSVTQMRSVSDYQFDLPPASASQCSTITATQSASHHTYDSQMQPTSDPNDDLALDLESVTANNITLPSTSNYNNDDDTNSGAIRKQYYNKNKARIHDKTPPPVPEFFPSSKGSVTMDSSDFRELELDNTYYLWYLKETGQLTDENDSDEPSEHSGLPKIDLTQSEAELDCTLPPIEPDFTNLPLPEIPDDEVNKK